MNKKIFDWWSCDGNGQAETRATSDKLQPFLSRREVLMGAGAGVLGWAFSRSALAQVAFSPSKDVVGQRDVLVILFLRGGADGLNMVVPYGEDAYYRRRPNLSLNAPKAKKAAAAERVLELDNFFGLHPSLSDLLPLYQDGDLAILHAVGSGDQTRSHFEAMSAMEQGLDGRSSGAGNGWLARYLSLTPSLKPSPLRAVAFGAMLPDSLRGASHASAIDSLKDFRLMVREGDRAGFHRALAVLHESGSDAVSQAGRETLEVLQTLSRLDPDSYQPEQKAAYPESELGKGLKQTAMLIKAQVGLEVACLDMGGWDTHVAQGVTAGWQPLLLKELGSSVAAFMKDLGSLKDHVTLVVMTEFGRRVYENSGLGTDHGRGSVMFLLGGGVNGGKVVSRWPGLEEHQLEGPGDLRVTTDYRDVLSEVLSRRAGCKQCASVFQGYQPRSLGGLVKTLA